MPGMFDVPEPDTLTLVRRTIALTVGIPEEQLALSVDPDFSFITNMLTVRLRTYMYGEELPAHTVTRTVYVPDGWWQHFRHDHANRWWMRRTLRRKPLRTHAIRMEATWENMAAYPWAQLRTPVPEQRLGAAIRLTMPPATRVTGIDGEDDD